MFLAAYERSSDLHALLKDRVAVMCVRVSSSSDREVTECGPVAIGQQSSCSGQQMEQGSRRYRSGRALVE